MGYIKQLSKHIHEGMDIVANFAGIEYSGKIVEKDFANLKDASLLLEDNETEGQFILLPVNEHLGITFAPDVAEEEEKKKRRTYSDMEVEELRELCKKRGVPFRKTSNRRGLINTLKYVDEHGVEDLLDDKKKGEKGKVIN